MADKAHRLTDEKLEEMEKRLSAIYSRPERKRKFKRQRLRPSAPAQ